MMGQDLVCALWRESDGGAKVTVPDNRSFHPRGRLHSGYDGRMALDLMLFTQAAEVANGLVVELEALGDAEGIEQLASDIEGQLSTDPLSPVLVSELRMRAEHLRSAATPAE
jgi:hypothetical protein